MSETTIDNYIIVEPDIDFADAMVQGENHEKERDFSLSKRIKEFREQKKLSFEQLAHSTGFDTQLLIDIESRKVSPALGTLIKISKALDSSLGSLVHGEGDLQYMITRNRDHSPTNKSTTKTGKKQLYKYLGLAPRVQNRNMEPMVVLLEHSAADNLSSHGGEEFIYVLEGSVVLNIDNKQNVLEPGDSVYYHSSAPHQVSAQGSKATILAVIYEGSLD